jgi:hypothetical protein
LVGEAPWAKGGNWQLWGPSWGDFVIGPRVELAVFRLTGEWSEEITKEGPGWLIRTASKWVYAVRAGEK